MAMSSPTLLQYVFAIFNAYTHTHTNTKMLRTRAHSLTPLVLVRFTTTKVQILTAVGRLVRNSKQAWGSEKPASNEQLLVDGIRGHSNALSDGAEMHRQPQCIRECMRECEEVLYSWY